MLMKTGTAGETLTQFRKRLAAEFASAYKASPFSSLSREYFARFSRDPKARPGAGEVRVTSRWKLAAPETLSPVGRRMAGDLAEFLVKCMATPLAKVRLPGADAKAAPARTIALLESGGGEDKVPESFTVTVEKDRVVVAGRDAAGLRSGIVHLVDQMGFRGAPILPVGTQTYRPRLSVRLGNVPWQGSFRDAVFMGYNAVFIGGGSLYALSGSDAIPELVVRRRPEHLAALVKKAREVAAYGLKCYLLLETRKKFPANDPIFRKYPGIRGSRTWHANGEYVLCTEHPLVKKYLTESMAGVFRGIPKLNGVVIIIGGEGFYHCHMRAHAKCPRCAKLGAETVVANLCNNLAAAVREVRPTAEVIAWPYSAYVWSADRNQERFIAKLKPGAAILTEVEKDETVHKPGGVQKRLWDYSIDMVGLGGRARRQLAACRKVGIPIYFKTEPELAFEAPGLPHVPCLDRWWARADAIAASGAAGMFNFSGTGRPTYGTSAAEVYKYACWAPAPKRDEVLDRLAVRLAGAKGGPHLRAAWKSVSEAIPFAPELPPYYTGPYYLGPAHPMCANPRARLPRVFYGRYLFRAEATDAEGLVLRPTFITRPRGNVPVFAKMYRRMEQRLKTAADEVNAARPLVPTRCRLMFDADVSSILWFYALARSHANFYEACVLRDQFAALAKADPKPVKRLKPVYDRWLAVLKDEKQNAADALPLAEADMRLDCYYGGDHCFSHMADMIRAKLKLIDGEINQYLPSLWTRVEPEKRE